MTDDERMPTEYRRERDRNLFASEILRMDVPNAVKDHVWNTERAVDSLHNKIIKLREELEQKNRIIESEKARAGELLYFLERASHQINDTEFADFCRDPMSIPSDRLVETYLKKASK